MTKKLFLICSSSGWGGTEKNVLLRAVELAKRGHHVVVGCVKGPLFDRLIAEEAIKVVRVKRGGDANPFSIFLLYRLIKKINPDVLFVTMNKDYWLAGLTGYLASVPKRIMYLGIERRVKKSIKYKLIHTVFLPEIIVNSRDIKNRLSESPYINSDSVHVIPNGFVVQDIVQQVALKKQLGIAESSTLIGAAGRITEQKGFDLLPEILSKLMSESVHVVIAGEGPLKADIIHAAKELKIDEQIHFIGFQNNMIEFFRNIDLFILTSRYEGMANVLNEAMSVGIPVVSTNVSGVQELLDEGRLGRIVAINDTTAMAKAIDETLSNEQISPALLKEQIEKKYSLRAMINATEAVFGIQN
jgi:glycosyltransferase involved in cell wall biosynthesis